MTQHIYDSAQAIACHEFPHGGHKIGVQIGEPYPMHAGLGGPAADTYGYTVDVSDRCFGGAVRVEQVTVQAIALTEKILADLDVAIAELNAHRSRLMNELAGLRERPIVVEELSL